MTMKRLSFVRNIVSFHSEEYKKEVGYDSDTIL